MNVKCSAHADAVPPRGRLRAATALLGSLWFAGCQGIAVPEIPAAPSAPGTPGTATTTSTPGLAGVRDKALEAIGYKAPALPEIPEAAKPPRRMALRVSASDSLNIDPSGRSLSLVVRVYKLRSATAFLNAPYEAFGNAGKEREAFGEEMIEARELLLLPGKEQMLNERWARDADFVGVVALFRDPAAQRWRYAFNVARAEADGLVLGVHACSLSVGRGMPVEVPEALLKSTPPPCR